MSEVSSSSESVELVRLEEDEETVEGGVKRESNSC